MGNYPKTQLNLNPRNSARGGRTNRCSGEKTGIGTVTQTGRCSARCAVAKKTRALRLTTQRPF
jgi:hypothetical protein